MNDQVASILEHAKQDGRLASDPASVYAELHATGERHTFSDSWQAPVFFKYADVSAILRDPGTFSNRGRVVNHLRKAYPQEAAGELKPLVDHYSQGLIHSDPPDQTRQRRLIQSAFVPRTLERLKPRVDEICTGLLDQFQERGRVDFVGDFAFQLPVTVIAEMLGIPHAMRDQFKRWSVGIVEFMATPNPTLEVMRNSQQALLELRDYFSTVFAERRDKPGEDVISLLLAARDEGDRLSEEELQATCVTLLIGGHETTTSLLTSAVWLIGMRPDLREALRTDPDRCASAVEEFLRYQPPFQRILRVASEDREVAGARVGKGDTLILLLGAANRDPDQFPDPDHLDIDRSPNKHLAFGYGIHHCLGASLTRLEAPAAIRHLLQHFPNYQCLTTEPDWHDGMVRSIKHLHIETQ